MRAIICWPVAASMRPPATPRITWRSVKWIRPSTDGNHSFGKLAISPTTSEPGFSSCAACVSSPRYLKPMSKATSSRQPSMPSRSQPRTTESWPFHRSSRTAGFSRFSSGRFSASAHARAPPAYCGPNTNQSRYLLFGSASACLKIGELRPMWLNTPSSMIFMPRACTSRASARASSRVPYSGETAR